VQYKAGEKVVQNFNTSTNFSGFVSVTT